MWAPHSFTITSVAVSLHCSFSSADSPLSVFVLVFLPLPQLLPLPLTRLLSRPLECDRERERDGDIGDCEQECGGESGVSVCERDGACGDK